MRGKLLMLAASMSLMLASASTHAHLVPDRKVKDHTTELVAPVAIAQVAVSMPADSVCRLVATASPAPTAQKSAAAGTTSPSRGSATDVVAPPNLRGSLARAEDVHQSTEAKYPLRPDPGRHRKGYYYR